MPVCGREREEERTAHTEWSHQRVERIRDEVSRSVGFFFSYKMTSESSPVFFPTDIDKH